MNYMIGATMNNDIMRVRNAAISLNKTAADLGDTIEGGTYDDYYKQYMESDSVKRRKKIASRLLPLLLGITGAELGAFGIHSSNLLSKDKTSLSKYIAGSAGGALAGTGLGALIGAMANSALDDYNKTEAWRYAAMRGNNRKALV